MDQIKRILRPTDVPDTGSARSDIHKPSSSSQAYYVIYSGLILNKTSAVGEKMIGSISDQQHNQ